MEADQESISQEVWALSGSDAIASRTRQLLSEATEEIVFVIGEETLASDELLAELNAIPENLTLHVGTFSERLEERIEAEVPHAEVFDSGLEREGTGGLWQRIWQWARRDRPPITGNRTPSDRSSRNRIA